MRSWAESQGALGSWKTPWSEDKRLRDKETWSRGQEIIFIRVNSTLMKQLLLCARGGGESNMEKRDPAFKGFSHQR